MNRNALYFETDTDYVSSFWNSEKFFVHIVDGHEILHQFWMVETRSKIMGCLTRFSTGDFAGPSTVFLIAGPGPGAHLGAPAKLPLDPGPAAALTVILTVPGDVENNDGERSGNHQGFFLWVKQVPSGYAMENPLQMEVLMGNSSINGPFSMAMLNNHRV